jgi:hypothetical protein
VIKRLSARKYLNCLNALENVLFAIEALEKVFLKKWLNWGFVVFIMVILAGCGI